MARYAQSFLDQFLGDPEYRREYGAAKIKSELAILLREARRQRNLTQENLARLVGVSQAYIARLESGNANPTIGRVGAIVGAMWVRLKFHPELLPASGVELEKLVLHTVAAASTMSRSPQTGTRPPRAHIQPGEGRSPIPLGDL